MRKYKREMLRREAVKQKISPSKYVRLAWDIMQKKLVGKNIRERNQARGTHKRNTWKARITASTRIKKAIESKDKA